MGKESYRSLGLAVLVVLGLVTVRESLVADAPGGLQLEIAPRKAAFLLGEPVVLTATLRNVSGEALLLPQPLYQVGQEDYLQVTFSHEGGPKRSHQSPIVSTWYEAVSSIQLAPGDEVEIVWVLGGSFYQNSEVARGVCGDTQYCWDFMREGRYLIEASCRNGDDRDGLWAGSIAAEPAEVSIVLPTGSAASAYEEWLASGVAQGLASYASNRLFGRHAIFRTVPAFEGLTRLQNSPYEPYARYFGAISHGTGAAGARRLDLLRELVGSLDQYPDFPLREEVLAEYYKTLSEEGMDDDANRIFELLQAENPQSLHVFREAPIAGRFTGR